MRIWSLVLLITFSFSGSAEPKHLGENKAKGPSRPEANEDARPLILKAPTGIKTLEDLHRWLQEQGLSEGEVVIKLGATWCGPCQNLIRSGILSRFAEKNRGKVKVLSLDLDEHPELAKILNPSGMVPALVPLKNDGKSRPGTPILKYLQGQPSPIGNFLTGQ